MEINSNNPNMSSLDPKHKEKLEASEIHREILGSILPNIKEIIGDKDRRTVLRLSDCEIEPYILVTNDDVHMEVCFYNCIDEFETCYLLDSMANQDAEEFDIKDPAFPQNLLQRVRDLNVPGRKAKLRKKAMEERRANFASHHPALPQNLPLRKKG